MYLINTTFFIDSSIAQGFSARIKDAFSAATAPAGSLLRPELFEISNQKSGCENELSFALQLRTDDDALLRTKEELAAVVDELMSEYHDKMVCFTTVMKSVEI